MDQTSRPSNAFALDGRVAVVTGGTRGIGLALAHGFAAEGARVVVASRKPEACAAAAAALRAEGAEALGVPTHLGELGDLDALVEATVAAFGGIDILVNNAAIFHGMRYETLLDVDLDYYYQIMKVNMHSPLVMTRAVAGSMSERGGGSVINQSSTAAWKAQGGYYGVAKLGVQGLTMCLASELGERNIRVNAIAPGPTDTEATRQVPAEILDQVGLAERADIVVQGTIVDFRQGVISEDDSDQIRESSAWTRVRIEIRDARRPDRLLRTYEVADRAEFLLARGESLQSATAESFFDLARRVVDGLESELPRASSRSEDTEPGPASTVDPTAPSPRRTP